MSNRNRRFAKPAIVMSNDTTVVETPKAVEVPVVVEVPVIAPVKPAVPKTQGNIKVKPPVPQPAKKEVKPVVAVVETATVVEAPIVLTPVVQEAKPITTAVGTETEVKATTPIIEEETKMENLSDESKAFIAEQINTKLDLLLTAVQNIVEVHSECIAEQICKLTTEVEALNNELKIVSCDVDATNKILDKYKELGIEAVSSITGLLDNPKLTGIMKMAGPLLSSFIPAITKEAVKDDALIDLTKKAPVHQEMNVLKIVEGMFTGKYTEPSSAPETKEEMKERYRRAMFGGKNYFAPKEKEEKKEEKKEDNSSLSSLTPGSFLAALRAAK
jgi:hypothetical protein